MSKRLTSEKKYAERAHFKKRLRERYGIRCGQDMYRSFVRQVKHGASRFLLKQSNTRSVHEIVHDGSPVVVVYDSKRGELCTALPLGVELGTIGENGKVELPCV